MSNRSPTAQPNGSTAGMLDRALCPSPQSRPLPVRRVDGPAGDGHLPRSRRHLETCADIMADLHLSKVQMGSDLQRRFAASPPHSRFPRCLVGWTAPAPSHVLTRIVV